MTPLKSTPKKNKIRFLLRAMRLDRWPRSTAIFFGTAALFFLHRNLIDDFSIPLFILRLVGAFILTWGISTANYVINEIADAPYDAHHPQKSQRPLVQGDIRKSSLILIGFLLVVSCLLLAFILFPFPFFLSLAGLLAAGFIYNLKPVRLKDIPFFDSISESANNPIRFFIGWFAFSPPEILPPISLLICWWAFGNYLLVAKRLSEFRFLGKKAGDYRASLQKYSRDSLTFGMGMSAGVFFVSYIYFTLSLKLELFLSLSVLIAIFFVFIYRKTLKEQTVMEEPERLLRHKKFAIFALFMLLCIILAAVFDRINI